MQFKIKHKIFFILSIMLVSIIIISVYSYKALTFSLNAFKISAFEQLPIITKILDLQYEAMKFRNKTNEYISHFGDSLSKLYNEHVNIEKNLDDKLSSLKSHKDNEILSIHLSTIEQLVNDLKKLAKEIIKSHKLKDEYSMELENIIVPISAFLKEKELDHVKWLMQLEESIYENIEFKGQTDPNLCAF